MKKCDLSKKVFGKLTVLHEVKKENSKKLFWKCMCECGENHITTAYNLTSGKCTMCQNCSIKESGIKRRKSYVGKRFGKLFVTEMIYGETLKSGKLITYCKCVCDCGEVVIRSTSKLKESNKPSCGCAKREIARDIFGINVDGRKYGKLTVLETLWEESPVKLRCKCDCGNIYIGTKSDITCGHVKSCGCLSKEILSKAKTKDFTGIVSDYGIEILSQHSKDRGQWVWNCKCGICGSNFVALPANIISGHTTSCGCRTQSSKESLIAGVLDNLKASYIQQYVYSDCIYKLPLKFDFAIIKDGKVFCLIEYDGRQHFEPVTFWGEKDFILTQTRDEIKNKYCKDNNIKLFRLPYTLTDTEIKEQIVNIINP